MKLIVAIFDKDDNISKIIIENDKKKELLEELNKYLKTQYIKNLHKDVEIYISINNSEFYDLKDILIEEKGKYKLCLKK